MQFHCWSFLDKIFECRKIVQLFSSANTIQKSVLLKHNYRLHKKLMKLYSNCQICIWKYYIYNYIYFHYYIYYHYLYFKNSTYLITNEKFSIIIISMTKKQRHHFLFFVHYNIHWFLLHDTNDSNPLRYEAFSWSLYIPFMGGKEKQIYI